MGLVISLLLPLICSVSLAQQESTGAHSHSLETASVDSLPKPIPIVLPPQLFIPSSRLDGLQPWLYAPITRPTVVYMPVTGFNGTEGFGQYSQEHPDKFFSNLLGRNVINLPNLYVTRQMMIGNTFRLFRNFYMLSGMMYGAQLGIMGNNWGMGNREGFIWHPTEFFSIALWNQYFQSLSVYAPVLYPVPGGDGAAVKMPGTPEVFSFGVQASFVAGEFIIGIGISISPKPFQKRKH